MIGERFYNPFGLDGALLRVEWAKVEPYTYNQSLPWNRYLYNDQPIGFALGSDAQGINVEFRHWASEKVTWSLLYSLEDQGEIKITDPWPVPITGPDSANAFPQFDHVPTGVVQRRNRITTSFWIHPKPGIDLTLGGGYVDVDNVNNVEGDRTSEWFFQGSLQLNWSRWLRPGTD